MSPGAPTPSPLDRQLEAILSRRRTNGTLRSLTTTTTHTDFSSNDFLSLATNASLKAAFLAELASSDIPLGSGGSRLLDGNSAYAEGLERDIAAFHNAEAGLLFNSGFDANAGFFACVPQRGDVIVYDECIHASVHDGMRLSRAASTLAFAHNDVQDLRRVLEELRREEEGDQGLGERNVFIAVEAVYSMDGDLAPLAEIVDLTDEILGPQQAYIIVDEAHATGVLGPLGRGLVCELGLEKRIFARLHTFGKALACSGGEFPFHLSSPLPISLFKIYIHLYMYVHQKKTHKANHSPAILLTTPLLRTYLLNYARPLIYTTSLSPPTLALISTTHSFLRSSALTPLTSHLHTLITTLFTRLSAIRTPAFRSLLRIPTVQPRSPIFSIELEEPRRLAGWLQGRGFMVRAVVPPTVREGTARVRVCLHAGNTEGEVGGLVGAMEEWCVEREREGEREDMGRVKGVERGGLVAARL